MAEWIRTNSSWLAIKSLIDNKLVANSYVFLFIIPGLIKLTETLPNTLPIQGSAFGTPIELQLSLPFQFFLLYFSALFFWSAWLSYTFRAPQFLKKYSNAAQAIAAGMTPQGIKAEAADFIESYYSNLPPYSSREATRLRRLLEQYRAPWYRAEEAWQSGDPAANGQVISNLLRKTVLIESYEQPNYYQLEPIPFDRPDIGREIPESDGTILIHRDQFMKHLSGDLIRLQDHSHRKCRIACLLAILGGFACLIYPILENLKYIAFLLLS